MDNYISHGADVFITTNDPDYLAITFHVISKVLGNEENDEDNMKPGPQLLSCILQNCREHERVNGYIESFLAICWQRISKGVRSRKLSDLLILVFLDALYYNPGLTLQILKQHDLIGQVFSKIFSMIANVKSNGK